MSEILPLIIICLLLAFFSHQYSIYDLRESKYISKEYYFYTIMVVIIVIFAGMRVDYNDTANYIKSYESLIISENWVKDISWEIGDYPLHEVVRYFMKSLGFSAQTYILIFSAFTLCTYLWFIRKYSNQILMSIFLFFAMGCFVFSLAALKQCVATAFSLIGIDRLLHEKKIQFIIWTGIGTLFHPFAALFFFCPILTFSPWTLPSYLLIAICAIAGFSLQTWLGRVIDLLSVVGVEYDTKNLLNESVSIFRVAVMWAPIILSFIARRFWKISEDKASNLILNLSTICAELMFIALFGNPIYFARLANYFLIFQTISLPFMLHYFIYGTRKFLNWSIVLSYSAYFLYGNVLSGNTFDTNFARITILEYIMNIFD